MRIAFFHDGDPRVPRLRRELTELGHEVFVVDGDARHRALVELFSTRAPDILHSLGRGPVALVTASAWARKLKREGTKRVRDVRPTLIERVLDAGVDVAVIDGSLPGPSLVDAYLRVLS